MSISLRRLISCMKLNDMIYSKKQKEIFEACELDLYKMQKYKDYLCVPYYELSSLYDTFLDDMHLEKVKTELHNKKDFETEFRRYIDCNKKYDHELFRYYYQFEEKYLKPKAIEWCVQNHIQYYEDI